MADHHNGCILCLAVTLNILKDILPAHRIQACSGFVQDQNLGFHGDDARNGYTAFLTTGQIKGRNLQLCLSQAHKAGSFPDTSVNFFRRQAHILGAERNIFIDGLFKKLILGILEYQTHTESAFSGQFFIRPDVLSIQQNLAGCRLQQTVHVLHKCGFAGTGVADHTNKFSPLNGERNILQGYMLKRCSGTVYVI